MCIEVILSRKKHLGKQSCPGVCLPCVYHFNTRKVEMNKLMAFFNLRRLVENRTITTRLTADGKEVPKRKLFENRITLIGTDNTVSITDVKNAQNLCLRRELKLVKVQDVDAKTRRPVYKLMTNAEYHAEEFEKRKEKQAARQNSAVKGEKLLTLSTKIGEHDLMTAIRKMVKLVEKQYEVKVIVTGEGADSTNKSESIYSVIEKNTKAAGRLVQKRIKGNTLRFQLLPLRDGSSQTGADQESSGNDKDKGPL